MCIRSYSLIFFTQDCLSRGCYSQNIKPFEYLSLGPQWNNTSTGTQCKTVYNKCCHRNSQTASEARHDKTNKITVRPAKTQISLGIRPVRSGSSLSAWRKLGSLATHWTHSEDSDQTGRMSRLCWVFAGGHTHFVGFVMSWLISFQRLGSFFQVLLY